jgi:hypothetical protein
LRFLALLAVMMVLANAESTAPRKHLQWIINGPALKYFTQDSWARDFFSGAAPFVLRRAGDPTELPANWNVREVRSFTSVRAIERAFENGTIDGRVRAVLYDNENWNFTPKDEQLSSVQSTQRAAELAHEHGLLLIASPAVNLVRSLDPNFSGKRFDRFLQLDLLGGAARYADVVVVQAQGAETALPLYSDFVNAAARQIRSSNQHATVLAGISTNPSGQKVTADQVLAAVRATESGVDGYWFNVPSPGPYCPGCTEFRPDIAIQVLRALAGGAPP